MSQLKLKQIKGTTSGSILFLNSSAIASESYSKLNWDFVNDKLNIVGDINISGSEISSSSNTVDSTTETIASVPLSSFDASFFDYVIKKGSNLRSGTVFSCHDGTNVKYTETSTVDLGDTSSVELFVDISGASLRLRATTDSDDWEIKTLIRSL